MKEPDAEEFLETDHVEKGIRSAAEAGAVIFGVLIDTKELGAATPDPSAHGIIIFSTDRRPNLRMLTEIEDKWVPLGIARYVPAIRNLAVIPRKRFEDRPQLMKYMEDVACSSLNDDPDLTSIVQEWL